MSELLQPTKHTGVSDVLMSVIPLSIQVYLTKENIRFTAVAHYSTVTEGPHLWVLEVDVPTPRGTFQTIRQAFDAPHHAPSIAATMTNMIIELRVKHHGWAAHDAMASETLLRTGIARALHRLAPIPIMSLSTMSPPSEEPMKNKHNPAVVKPLEPKAPSSKPLTPLGELEAILPNLQYESKSTFIAGYLYTSPEAGAPPSFYILYNDGSVVAYRGVPSEVYERFAVASSRGAFFNAFIRDKFTAIVLRKRTK